MQAILIDNPDCHAIWIFVVFVPDAAFEYVELSPQVARSLHHYVRAGLAGVLLLGNWPYWPYPANLARWLSISNANPVPKMTLQLAKQLANCRVALASWPEECRNEIAILG